jgi:hypothetical protein
MNIRKTLVALSFIAFSIPLFSMNEEKFDKVTDDEVVRLEIGGKNITLCIKKGTSKVFMVKEQVVPAQQAPIQQTKFSPKPQTKADQLKRQIYLGSVDFLTE